MVEAHENVNPFSAPIVTTLRGKYRALFEGYSVLVDEVSTY